MESLFIIWGILIGLWCVWQVFRFIGFCFSSVGNGINKVSERRQAQESKIEAER